MIENLEHPWFLLLLLLILPLLIWRKPKYFLRHSYLPAIMGAKKIALIPFLKWIGWLLIILAAVDYGVGYQESYKKLITHQYVLINDGSGSMVDGEKPNGVGKNLTILLKANDQFLKTLEDLRGPGEIKDSVSMLVFSNDPFIVSYFVEDYDFIRQKMLQVDWSAAPLNLGTETNKAIWAGIKLILKKNKELIKGSSLIIFTDGVFPISGNEVSMSVLKLLSFCREMDIRVYLISVEQMDSTLLNHIKLTGGEGMIISDFNPKEINNAYQKIVNQQAGEYEVIDRLQKKSYADWLAGAGLALLLTYIVVRNTVSRSLTEI